MKFKKQMFDSLVMLVMLVCMLLCSMVRVNATLYKQLSTAGLAPSTTNTYAIAGDTTGNFTNGIPLTNPNSLIDGSQTTQLPCEVGGFFTNTALSGVSNVTFVVASSVDYHIFTNAAQTVVVGVPALTTNYCATFFFISGSTGGPMPAYVLRQVQNPNTTVSCPSNALFFVGVSKKAI